MNRDRLHPVETHDALDEAISRSLQEPVGSDAAVERVLARLEAQPLLPAQKRGLLSNWWPSALTDLTFAPAWPRIAALACGAGLGIAVGLSSYGTRIAVNLDLVTVAAADEAGANAFDLDSELRP
jgi:hypothetical protein